MGQQAIPIAEDGAEFSGVFPAAPGTVSERGLKTAAILCSRPPFTAPSECFRSFLRGGFFWGSYLSTLKKPETLNSEIGSPVKERRQTG